MRRSTGLGMSILQINNNSITIKRAFETIINDIILALPAVLTVEKTVQPVRIPGLAQWLNAIHKPIRTLSFNDLELKADRIGLNGSPTKVVRTNTPKLRAEKTLHIKGPAEQCAKMIMQEIRKRGVL